MRRPPIEARGSTTCRALSLPALRGQVSTLIGRRVRLNGVVDAVYDAGAGWYYKGFPGIQPTTYLEMSPNLEAGDMPDQVVVAFVWEEKDVSGGQLVTVWGVCRGRTWIDLADGGRKKLPVVEAMYVVAR